MRILGNHYRSPDDGAAGGGAAGTGAAGTGSAGAGGAVATGTGGEAAAQGLLAAAAAAKAAETAAAAAAAGGNKGDPAAGEHKRPEDVPENFWDPKTGAVNYKAWAKSTKDTRTELESLKTSKGAPGKALDYKFEIPETLTGKLKADDPAIALFQTLAHEAGLSQEQFGKISGKLMEKIQAGIPPGISIADETKKLGEHADLIMTTVLNWGEKLVKDGIWSPSDFQEITIMGSTAEGILALNKLRTHYTGESPIPTTGSSVSGLPSAEELYAKVADPRYQNDKGFREQTEREFQAVFGTEPASSSKPGMGVPAGRIQPAAKAASK
jgi:hypothetical protein